MTAHRAPAPVPTLGLRLRHWAEADRAAFASLNADPEVMRYFPSTLTAEESNTLADRIEAHFHQHDWGLWVAEVEGDFAGFIGLNTVTFDTGSPNAPEIGWRLAERFWHRGIATEGARSVLDFAFTELQMQRVVSFTSTLNTPSIRVMERIGMHRIGQFEHPRISEGDPLRPHYLYEVTR